MKLIIFGDRKSCPHSQALDKLISAPAFKRELTRRGIALVDADKRDAFGLYTSVLRTYRLEASYPQLLVCDDSGDCLGRFSPRVATMQPWSGRELLNRIEYYGRDLQLTCPKCGHEFTPA